MNDSTVENVSNAVEVLERKDDGDTLVVIVEAFDSEGELEGVFVG